MSSSPPPPSLPVEMMDAYLHRPEAEAGPSSRSLRPRSSTNKPSAALGFSSQLKPSRPNRSQPTKGYRHATEPFIDLQTDVNKRKRTDASSSDYGSPSASPSPPPTIPRKKKKQITRRYDDPSTTLYPVSSYPPLNDHLYPSDPTRRLDVLICGLNPGLRSSKANLHFAHPTNHFYRTLYQGGFTPEVVKPADCSLLVDQAPPLPSLGLTNICRRATAEGGELGKKDFEIGTPILEEKIRRQCRPRMVVFTGKGIGGEWERCCRLHGALSAKPRAKKAASNKGKRGSVKEEESPDDQIDSKPGKLVRTITLPFPTDIAWATTNALGLGLLPYVVEIDWAFPAAGPVKTEDDANSSSQLARPQRVAVSPYNGHCFFFLTTSPSGRVTTMGIKEKGEWMRKGKDCLDFIMQQDNEAGGSSSETSVNRKTEAEESKGQGAAEDGKVERVFEVIDWTAFPKAAQE